MNKTKIFISSEIDRINGITKDMSTDIADYYIQIEKKINSLLKSNDYGDALLDGGIGIIMTIYSKKYLETIKKDTGKEFPERIIYRRKTKDSDVRLRVDYEKFIESTGETRKGLILQNIIDSILALNEKIKKHKDVKFLGEKLVNDLASALEK